MEDDHAAGPVTIDPLRGEIHVPTAESQFELAASDLLMLGAGVRSGVASSGGGAFLLKVVHPPAATGPA